jgi:hypothetical protein
MSGREILTRRRKYANGQGRWYYVGVRSVRPGHVRLNPTDQQDDALRGLRAPCQRIGRGAT